MELPLIVGVDGSDSSLVALDWAVDEAARQGLPLRLVYASLWERYEDVAPSAGLDRPTEQVMAENIVGTAAERAQRRNPDVKVSAEVVPEEAVDALLREGHNASALVTGSRGRGELKGLLLGSVGLAVAARAHCPVIVVRGDKAGVAGTHERIVLGAGDPASGGEAVRFAFREAETRGAVLDVVRSWRCPAHEGADEPRLAEDPAHLHEERASAQLDALLYDAVADHPGVRVRRSTVEGAARKVLLNRSAAADLVIVGARRRTGHFGLQLGRVAHTLLHHAQCPVAIVPQRV
ncbi:nucleotide-binding universal stress UspA family protein [Streptomyces sp. SAI-208]|uniref:universal stress protein n=1 Tax=unclassified Streptomyces TaxID=2593676 RepID=UPI0024749C17|nr:MULTISPECIES: universal stress protein [unclassified Streptomyces]MDH6514810.1 nucleotide-binding universal stress UspA family protein [Streptomyces sp. SAI-090]MDH6546992.1 nucleotide-binding universal stress UspA family protein [Streptomyces sp. SAI-041]MDH6605657.1 nucleotide-binding universal stress UspA family protein [Streptomyces sp. SAI-208]MDH6621108.1 nucleotide-binding universal stress UspA family protein [Streptomyces sp. SAI-135]